MPVEYSYADEARYGLAFLNYMKEARWVTYSAKSPRQCRTMCLDFGLLKMHNLMAVKCGVHFKISTKIS